MTCRTAVALLAGLALLATACGGSRDGGAGTGDGSTVGTAQSAATGAGDGTEAPPAPSTPTETGDYGDRCLRRRDRQRPGRCDRRRVDPGRRAVARVPQPDHLVRQRLVGPLVGHHACVAAADGTGRRQQLPALPHSWRGADRRQRRAGRGRRRHLHADLPAEPRRRLERRNPYHQRGRSIHLAGQARHRRHAEHRRLRPHHRRRHRRSAGWRW